MAARNTKKVLGTVLALGAATGAIVFGSFAAWTAQSSNPGNSVTTGTLDFSNDKSAAAVFTATGIKPGDTGGSTVQLANTGSVPLTTVTVTQDNVVNTIGTDIKLKIYDATADYCVWPDKDAGACAGFGAWSDADLADGVPVTGTWTTGTTHTFNVDWDFDVNTTNATKNKAASFDLTWDGAQ